MFSSKKKPPAKLRVLIQDTLRRHEHSFHVRTLPDLDQVQWRGGYWLVPIQELRSPTRYAFYEFLATVEEDLEREGQDVVLVPVTDEITATSTRESRNASKSTR